MSALPEWLFQELKDAGGSPVFTVTPQALRDHYERISKKVFAGMTYGKAKKPLHATPYCFRHALATELRTSGWSVDEIAAVLGQRSADTQSHYGLRKGRKRKPKAGNQLCIVAGSVRTTSLVQPPKKTEHRRPSKSEMAGKIAPQNCNGQTTNCVSPPPWTVALN